ncbi:Sorbose reductase sou1 [Penicillium waksmanii]|uniref:Sorbose reductase sou1 n=1 Tax=Penicillium waksmanii TaxID=69791 RepID=UPI00254984DF|nr:Sorbose reductase sou1 [Penicillium waksmanii]KAJ5994919.1 Sorbose reductase sou1 [Penicillium waksmanii]
MRTHGLIDYSATWDDVLNRESKNTLLIPGKFPVFPTDLTTNLIHGTDPTIEGPFPLDQIPAERAGTPEDVMGSLLYLASRAEAYCNGNCVLTDGERLSVTPAT